MTLYSPSVSIRGTAGQRRSFHYFQSRNMSDMPGNFEPSFWNRMILQFSHNYPTVQQSLVALSAIYEANDQDNRSPGSSMTASLPAPHALHQYNKAVRHLVEYLSSTQHDLRVTLISCLIFVWIEILQNNLDAAFKHLDGGLKILRDIRVSLCIPSYAEIPAIHDAEDIYGSLSRSFIRLRIQAAIHGSQLPGITTTSTREIEVIAPVPHSFTSVFESRSFLDNEINSILGYLRELRDTDHYASVDMLAIDQIRRAHLERIQQWHIATTMMATSTLTQQDLIQSSGVAYLQLYHIFLETILKTMLSGSEMAFDEYTSEFERMLALAERLASKPDVENPPVLSFDMNVIPPLFFLVLKCRVLRLRLQAVALLKRAPKQEGMWRRDGVIKVCNWKIMIEEQGRGQLAETDMLPESARIYGEHIPEKRCWGKPPEYVLPRIYYNRGAAGHLEYVEMPDGFEEVYDMGNML
jgi:hypothetical protein